MANRPHVPRFGDWDKQDAPFTVVFDNARKKRNLYDMEENSERSSNQGSPPRAPRTPNPPRHEPVNHQIPKQTSQDRRKSRDEAEFRRFTPSPATSDKNRRVRPQAPATDNFNNPPYGGRVVNPTETNRRTPPPQHPPPAQPRPIPNVRGQEYRKAAAIPPFPGQGRNSIPEHMSYTHIFDNVREERNERNDVGRAYGGGGGGGGTSHSTPSRPFNNHSPGNSKSCCFPWSSKGKH